MLREVLCLVLTKPFISSRFHKDIKRKPVAMSTLKEANMLREEGNCLYIDGNLIEGTLSLTPD